MKYYIYISDAKVDMLLTQLSQDVQGNIATEFKVDLKLFSASRKKEVQKSDERIARLERLEDFINKYGNVGDIANPDEYVHDILELDMKSVEFEPPLVYFCGRSLNRSTFVAIGGSAGNLIGYKHQADTAQIPDLIPVLLKSLDDDIVGEELTENITPEQVSEIEKELYESDRSSPIGCDTNS